MFKYLLIITSISFTSLVFSQKEEENDNVIKFTEITNIKTTEVKSQDRAGTCWDYATTSFIETEAIRLGKPELNLSEMFTVRYDYVAKAKQYIQLHGKTNFSPGGQAHHMINIFKQFGAVPENIYSGLEYGDTIHRHGEMLDALTGFLKGVNKNSDGKITTAWLPATNAIIESYLGKVPEKFKFNGKEYTPKTFATNVVGINPDDYIEITSYSDAPFYSKYVLKIPDNWDWGMYYNIPINDLMEIMKYALKNGYSIDFDGDVTEPTFNYSKGIAVLPYKNFRSLSDEEQENVYKLGFKEINVTQKYRQTTFNSRETTDDHLMHITGMAKDQSGRLYFKTKNSWGKKSNEYSGYLYMSENYVKLKTVAIMVHKKAIPDNIAKKMGL